MKFLSFLTIASTVIITSCTKDNDDTCYECKQQTYEVKENDTMIGSSSSTIVFCDKSESDIKKLEAQNTYTKTENGITKTSTYKCNLKK
ncbi:hypothetical protein LF887_08510 [Chryseobacterium sp. MEBOG06]|uniref:hypothetical protein n=1 Tax=unclassified Chryseobacterium TaxID=2593645 RepID=UPI001F1A08B7|nr:MULTISPECIES: hypothetical protein [unclassified Chryseobacterium]UKB85648.1 hypothetical protein LF887_08510 [Chryseobacterium sp. MEBOG06]